MKRYLVTGGAGFIGSNFIHYLSKQREEVGIVNLDALTYAGNLDNLKGIKEGEHYKFVNGSIADVALVRSLFETHHFDCVVSFAAESHVDRSISDPSVFVKTNVLGTQVLLDAAMENWRNENGDYRDGVKFVQISTDEVYGALGKTGFFTESTPIDPHSPYSASKAAADLLVKSYADTFSLPVNITRCSNNYGPFQFPEKLIPLMICNCLNHKKLPIYGDGQQVRDWIHVRDHCSAILLVAEKGLPGEVYNIGGKNERTNLQIVSFIISHIHTHVDPNVNETQVKHVRDRKGHDYRYAIDAGKIKEQLGWRAETSFEDGLLDTINWYVENQSWLERVISGDYQDYYKKQYGMDH